MCPMWPHPVAGFGGGAHPIFCHNRKDAKALRRLASPGGHVATSLVDLATWPPALNQTYMLRRWTEDQGEQITDHPRPPDFHHCGCTNCGTRQDQWNSG